ncbi:MAG: DUF58 domain-containing protein, partial [Planctomycetaceae bacterium]
MKFRPGINAVRLAAILFGLTSFAYWSPLVLWPIAATGSIAVVLSLFDYRALRKSGTHLQVVRRLPAVVGRGESFEITWTITTPDGHPVSGQLRDELPDISHPRWMLESFTTITASPAEDTSPPRNMAVITRRIRIPQRGRYTIGPMWVRLSGPLRLLDGQQGLQLRDAIRVLPEMYASPDRFRKELASQIHLLDKPVFARHQGDGTDFESLKEYRPGDDPRRIDWRATARMQRPIVRKFQIERHRDVLIAIDCGRLMGSQVDAQAMSMRGCASVSSSAVAPSHSGIGVQNVIHRSHRGTKLDCAVDAALLLARTALQGGDRCGFGLFDHSVRGFLPPVAGLAALPALVDCVYDAAVDWGESDFAPMFAALQRR